MRTQPSLTGPLSHNGLTDIPDTPTRDELVAAWVNDYGNPPPRGIGSRLLDLAAAYHRQAETEGGLRPDTRKKLLAYAVPDKEAVTHAKPAIGTGTRLVREWRGEKHIFDILDEGILYRGETLTSLSSVATHITGARWSGPRFFGVKDR